MHNDQLKDYFESLNSRAELDQLITDGVKENLYLEFKEKHDFSTPDLHRDDQENFSKVLSGFANSDGGILIWGIKTAKPGDKAIELCPINQLDDFASRLQQSLINTVQPFIDGIRFGEIHGKHKGTGYLKVYVPRSDKTPHRAMLAGREYWKRGEHGFYRLEHFDLEDMFGRRQKPLLEINLDYKSYTDNEESANDLGFSFVNSGRAIARYYGFFCKFDNNFVLKRTAGTPHFSDVTNLNHGLSSFIFSDVQGVIHPNGVRYSMATIGYAKKDPKKPITGSITYYCDGMMAKEEQFVIA